MKIRNEVLIVGALALSLLGTSAVTTVEAQQKRKIMVIRNISVNDVRTPEYETKPNFKPVIKEWKQFEVEYATDPDWVDELTFTYYVLLKNSDNAKPNNPRAAYTLLRGDVVNMNIKKGSGHVSVMYLHPSTVDRYGELDRLAVLVTHEGTSAAMETQPSSKTRWWEEMAPVTGLLHNRLESPFAMIAYDRYEAIKVSSAGSR